MAARALVHVIAGALPGQPVEVRALISHPMETGYRPGADGKVVARDIIRRFSCHYNGELVFAAALHPAIAANPYFAFFVRAGSGGTLECRWEGDKGFAHTETTALGTAP